MFTQLSITLPSHASSPRANDTLAPVPARGLIKRSRSHSGPLFFTVVVCSVKKVDSTIEFAPNSVYIPVA